MIAQLELQQARQGHLRCLLLLLLLLRLPWLLLHLLLLLHS
jgi:hypothetical protein